MNCSFLALKEQWLLTLNVWKGKESPMKNVQPVSHSARSTCADGCGQQVAGVRLDEVLDTVPAWEALSRVMNKQELPLLPGRLIPSINYYHHIEIILYWVQIFLWVMLKYFWGGTCDGDHWGGWRIAPDLRRPQWPAHFKHAPVPTRC